MKRLARLRFTLCLGFLLSVLFSLSSSVSQSELSVPQLGPGQSATELPDGKWLLIGGEEAGTQLGTATIWNPRTGTTDLVASGLRQPRSWHSATLLPNGTVLVFGGVGADGSVLSTAEVFNPQTQSFDSMTSPALAPRAHQTATLLTDGRVLIAGGMGSGGELLTTADLFDLLDPSSPIVHPSLGAGRRDHTASLLSDGRMVLSGGTGGNGVALDTVELFDPQEETFASMPFSSFVSPSSNAPGLEASLPFDGAIDVPLDTIISLRFSKPLRADTVNAQTVSLLGPSGIELISVVPAEGGILAFITPKVSLQPGATYAVTINGAADREGLLLQVTGLAFTTKRAVSAFDSSLTTSSQSPSSQPSAPGAQLSAEKPDDWEWQGEWRDGKPHSRWQDLPPLQAAPGLTALAGQALDLKGEPLKNVALEIETSSRSGTVTARTDETGRFLLRNITAGRSELIIDARRAYNPNSSIEDSKWGYGVFEVGVEVKDGQTNVISYTIWLPKIDAEHAVKIPSPTTAETVIATPYIPGLELHIASNTFIKDHEGKLVNEVSLTPIPLDRTPFPLPRNVEVPIYFTAQPGGAYIYGSQGYSSQGVRVVYPNYKNRLPGTRFTFWHYDPEEKGWYIYGLGTVTESGAQVVPDPQISVHEFTGAMVADPGFAPAEGEEEGDDDKEGEPVDLSTGLFTLNKTDLSLSDTIPIVLTRTYRTRDTFSRAFGIGASHSYDMFFVGDTNPWTFIDLILPSGGRIHYDRISAGTSFEDAVYEHVKTPSRFYKSRISWNGAGWDLKLKDGTLYAFRDGEGATRPGLAGVIRIQDRNGNVLTIDRDTNGNVTKVTSPNSRWIEFTNDSSNRITQVKDNIGRMVIYEYDPTGRLIKVTDPNNGITEYTYDTSQRMLTIKDARGIVFLTNEYDATGKVIKQTQADTTTFQFAYTTDVNGKITQTDVTDPRGNVKRLTFNANSYTLTNRRAVGKPEEQLTTYVRQTGTNLPLTVTDALSRQITYTYDSMGNVLTVTRLTGTPDAVTTTYTYEPSFNQVATKTDPLNHTTAFTYDAKGNLITATDPLNNQTTFAYNPYGQRVAVTTAVGTTQFTYEIGDLVAITDSLGNITRRFVDSAGRGGSLTNPLGNITRYDFGSLNRLSKVTDALAGITEFSYDNNGNLLTVKDARNNVTSYTYNNMDRLETRNDPLLKAESYAYDNNGNLSQFTDRKTQATSYTYDALNRRTGVTYADTSTTTYTYDAGDRLTQVVDSVSGTITRGYDGLDRLTSETTPQGSISYTYDNANRRTTMTVAGQPMINYTYDNANRLAQITQGGSIVTFAYDNANRRTSLTLPNGILVEYAYDAVSRVTGITYKQNGTTVLGNLTYEYDKAGNRTKVGGTWARTGLPEVISTTNYNAANRQLTFGNKTLTYDDNGNLTSIIDTSGTTLYTWNARNQLTGISGPGVSTSFVYDGVWRREKKTINSNLTEFLFDGVNPVQETSGATILANMLSGLGIDEFFTRTDVGAGTISSFLPETLGSAVALANSAGVVQTEYTYEPFGRTTVTGASNSNPFQYTGRENDGAGLYYYRARYYQPELHRFISEDPFGCGSPNVPPLKYIQLDPQYSNFYAYVNNRVLNLNDPLGLCPDCRYYEARCREVVNPVSKGYYCTVVPTVCNRMGCGPTMDCIRNCLQDYDRDCVTLFGRKDPYGGVGPVCHELGGHAYCIPKCVLGL
jgi:RHS repeat-associated protein